MENSIAILENMIDELQDMAYNQKSDLLSAKRNEISFVIKNLFCDKDDVQKIVSSIIKFFLKYYKRNGAEELMKYRMVLDILDLVIEESE